MPLPVVTAETVLDAIKSRLDLIVGGADFHTNPSKQVGVPRSAVPEGAGEAVYLVHSDSETITTDASPTHMERATYLIWCMSRDPAQGHRKGLRLVRDVQKVLRSGYPALEAAGANAGIALGRYTRDERAEEVTGATVYSLTLTADWIVDLTA